jgi:formylglycine-generating enzyme required for sulfatase activity
MFAACDSGDDGEQLRTWGGNVEDDDDVSNPEGDDDETDDDETDDDDSGDDDGIGNHLDYYWIEIPAGEFTMGSPVEEQNGESDVETQHKVKLTHSFEIMNKELSFGQWSKTMTYSNASANKCHDEKCPMAKLTIWEAMAFANEFSVKEGLTPCYNMEDVTCFNTAVENTGDYCEEADGIRDVATFSLAGDIEKPYECEGYRLPTEAEWEYAARAGANTHFYNGEITYWEKDCSQIDPLLDEIAYYSCNVDNNYVQYVDSDQKAPNNWKLYHMLGNVREWVYDEWGLYPEGEITDPVNTPEDSTEDWRIARGGSVGQMAHQVRLARRMQYRGNHSGDNDNNRSEDLGFRLVRTTDL